MKKTFISLIGILSMFNLSSCQTESEIISTTVDEFDIEQYMGRWYEIARFDHKFERGLVGCTADYSLNDDGTVKVVNSGYRDDFDGKFKQSEGVARQRKGGAPGELEVSFFLWFYGDYNVLEIDPDYQNVLVGSSTDNYLWILSRQPAMLPAELNHLLNCAESRGYDINNLIWVEHYDTEISSD